MSSPALDISAKGLIRIVRAIYRPASHIEFAFYLSPDNYSLVKPYLKESMNFKEETYGKLVLRERFFNIFVYANSYK